MNKDLARIPLLFILLCAMQVFVCNHGQLFGCATPLFYVYFLVTMRKGMAKWAIMVLAFVMGIILDTFANTPGVTAASMTASGLMQPYLLDLFITRENDEEYIPSSDTLGLKPFVNYTIVSVAAYSIIFFTLEMLSWPNLLKWIECVVGSTLLTVLLILAVDRLTTRK